MATSKKTTPPMVTWEVLSEGPTGRRSVHRVDAPDVDTARQETEAALPHGHRVVDAAEPGKGVGSRDREVPQQ